MSSLDNLRNKYCMCCNVRLDTIKRPNLRHVKGDLVEKLNSVKNSILTKKGKTNDNIEIQENDIICTSCISHANRFGTIASISTGKQLV